jgi:hypothetical protein
MTMTPEQRRRYRERHPDKILAERAAYRARHPERSHGDRVGQRRRYRERYPEKERARARLADAVARGRVTRPDSCMRCGGPGPIEGHHWDYSQPLNVMWLCRVCHWMMEIRARAMTQPK